MIRPAHYFQLLLPALLLSGCSSAPRATQSELEYVPPPQLTPHAAVLPPSQKPVSNVAPPAAPRLAAPAPANRFDYSDNWIPLEKWCQAYGFGSPRRVASDTAVTYSFALPNASGSMTVRIGSQLATWRGIEYRLGYAPQIINGRPCLHSLDLRKNFLPLLDIPPLNRNNRSIVIDPGHGGTDTGTQNIFNNHSEKEFTLDWARRLQNLLAASGWTVWLTRTDDVNLPLAARVAFADQHNAGLFISLHFNSAAPAREEAGLETYCLTPRGMPSNLTRGFRDDVSLAFPNNAFDSENIQYAAYVHRELLKVNGHLDRGVRRARFLGVLQGQNRPAILIEGGYLSNPHEAREIADPQYREKLAEAVALALNQNFTPMPLPDHPAPPPAIAPTSNSISNSLSNAAPKAIVQSSP